MPLGAAELSPQLRASWLGGRALGGWGCRSAKPSTIVCHPTANRPCVGHHQKCESDATLFVCYDAVTALRERFCQNAFARRGDGSRSGACHLGVQLGGSARLLHCPRQLPASLDRGQWDGGSLRMHWRCRVSAFRATLRLKDRSPTSRPTQATHWYRWFAWRPVSVYDRRQSPAPNAFLRSSLEAPSSVSFR